MMLLPAVSLVAEQDFPRVLVVWEALVRATHHFVGEEDILFFRPLVQSALPRIEQIACVRDECGLQAAAELCGGCL